MDSMVLFLGFLTLAGGIALVMASSRRAVIDPGAVLADLDGAGILDEFSERLTLPIISRLFKPFGRLIATRVGALLPRNYVEGLRHKLLVAGVSATLGPEEFVVLQAVGVAGGLLLGVVAASAIGYSGTGLVRLVAIAGLGGFLSPRAWLRRRRDARQMSIRKDLPDVLDLLAISVEAGVGFEGAIEVVIRHFDTPLGIELSRTLREMELGLPRREALQNLKRRVEVPELSNFVLILVQADALGMPIGRVLRTQAAEMRSKRRQWARERAGQLPVKLMIPLVIFILPALFVVILGPAVPGITGAF